MNIDQNVIIEQTVDYFLRYWLGTTKPGLLVIRRHIHSMITRACNHGKLSQLAANHWNTYRMAIEANRRLRQRRTLHAPFKRRDPDRTATSIEDEIQRTVKT